MNSGDYNVWADVLTMSIPLAGMCAFLIGCKIQGCLDSRKGKERDHG